MSSKNDMTRKDFLTLTFTLIGTTAVGAAACSSSNNTADGGVGGTTGHGGTTGAGGTSHSTGQGGTSGAAGTSANGGGGGTSASSCADPLPEVQAPSDHTHTVTIHPSVLDSTSAQMFDTSAVLGHMHIVTLQPADLATIKGGGSVMSTSSSAGTPAHTHVFTISCH